MKYLKHCLPRDSSHSKQVRNTVGEIISRVQEQGDEALIGYNIQFDKNTRKDLRVTRKEIDEAYTLVTPEMAAHMRKSAEHIRSFAERQKSSILPVKDFEVAPGILLSHNIIPVASCCAYVPGGAYPLYSTALMLAIPAKVAGVGRITACSPAHEGSIHPATLVAMDIAGVDEIYTVGGAQAIAAFSYGTRQIKPVDLIVGPGNQYVTEAKRQCYGQVGIDFIAGPSEVLVICDETGDPEYIAADILAQSEHDLLAKGIVITTDENIGNKIIEEVARQLETLPTENIARSAWEKNGEVILVGSIDEACRLSNDYAPEHLEIHVKNEDHTASLLTNYGSLFIGAFSAEVFGDYASGTNHTLPTVKASRYTGGVYVGSFLKICTAQKITEEGIRQIGSTSYEMALGEGLYGHANAAKVRMQKITRVQ